ncbi:hypothetical protein GBF38_004861, partial [Nibea albiflora]
VKYRSVSRAVSAGTSEPKDFIFILSILSISIMSGTKEEDRKGSSEWREFFWNPRTHEFMGRTASSWGESCPLTPSVCLSVRSVPL